MRIRTLLTAALLAALPLSGALAKDAALAKAVASEQPLAEPGRARQVPPSAGSAGVRGHQADDDGRRGLAGRRLLDRDSRPVPEGQGHVLHGDVPRGASARRSWNKKLADNKARWGDVKVAEFGKGSYEIAPAGSADLVITSRNVHNWMGAGFAG